MFEQFEQAMAQFNSWVWDLPLVFLLVGGGLFFLIYSRFTPFRYLKHSINILRGKYDDPNDPGELNHFQALSSAIAATVGLGNLSGVAAAIATGGPGALFWMWMTGIVGMATKFFTCTLSLLYREKAEDGQLYGGPMYMITHGMGQKWKPLAIFFALAGLVGTLPAITANQLTQTVVDVLELHHRELFYKVIIGTILCLITALVIFGGIKRIGSISAKLVPSMVILYFILVFIILFINMDEVPSAIALIFQDAFTGEAVKGGVLGELIRTGVKRGAFSNEAGVGTAPMMHGTAKTKEPIREGLVAMLGPAIDTLIVCTLTALAILVSGVWKTSDTIGVTLTIEAFHSTIPFGIGNICILIIVLVFGCSTLFSYSHYGISCLGFLTKHRFGKLYNWIYIASIVFVSVIDFDFALNIIDNAFALMAIPNIICTIWLSPKVIKASKIYFKNLHLNK